MLVSVGSCEAANVITLDVIFSEFLEPETMLIIDAYGTRARDECEVNRHLERDDFVVNVRISPRVAASLDIHANDIERMGLIPLEAHCPGVAVVWWEIACNFARGAHVFF